MLELTLLDDTIRPDIRYAREDNFVGRPVYAEARAFLQPVPAHALVRVHRSLKPGGLGLVIYDGYRPWSVTKLFWETVAEDQKKFVADPAVGSKHNRGCAVDLSMCELSTGTQVPMPSDFDEFNEKASPDYSGGTDIECANRDRLRAAMEAEGFAVNPKEWWHFDHKDWQSYEIVDLPFDEL
ncbi:MAG TPA: M15 family metallopeptidase [Aridibacter sp.]|nr:M15 family metallopeptidase [Aridibacter sp.]